MKLQIRHEIPGRIRFSTGRKRLTPAQADLLLYYLLSLEQVDQAKVYERTADAFVYYHGTRNEVIKQLAAFSFPRSELKELVPEQTGHALNSAFRDRLIWKIASHWLCRLFLPTPFRMLRLSYRSAKFLRAGMQCLCRRRIEVPLLDATAISVSLLRKDFSTAASVMFLLEIGEILEEWTHKKTVADLARSMALGTEKVWLCKGGGTEILTEVKEIREGEVIAVRVGSMIPLDGMVVDGEAMVNQSSLTGESIPVRKENGAYVYAGTAVEEGMLRIQVRKAAGATRYEKIVRMIEESEKMKSGAESQAEHLADRLVPYTLLGTVAVYLLTRNVSKALSVLMVDFSCALKLAMPVAVLSAMRECREHELTVKGGKFLEAVADADTLVFDKTGTLTKACPVIADLIPFGGYQQEEVLRIAACLEEHFPHSIANAVVAEAARRGLKHDEMHSKVEYVVAHGIASYINGQKAVIGSSHFIFEDEGVEIPEGEEEKFARISKAYSHLYLAISGKLAAVLCIQDPLREEAVDVVRRLHACGFRKIAMMTGDSRHIAEAVAQAIAIDHYEAEVLPEDKAAFVEAERAGGHKVVMVGDGINDSPALSAADAGIAVSEGAQLAREIADITISENNLYQLIALKQISNALMKRIHFNYRFVIGFNLGLIVMGLGGILTPNAAAYVHNLSTLGIGLKSMTNLLPEREEVQKHE